MRESASVVVRAGEESEGKNSARVWVRGQKSAIAQYYVLQKSYQVPGILHVYRRERCFSNRVGKGALKNIYLVRVVDCLTRERENQRENSDFMMIK